MREETKNNSSHNFIESIQDFGEFHRVIYCTQCGVVAWHFNYNDGENEHLQSKIPQPCPANIKPGVKAVKT